jgi:hypothetical protein
MPRMPNNDLTWTPVSDDLPLLVCSYSFGPGYAIALAAPCDGGYVVVSPPCNAPESTFAGIEKRGKVRALVASNAFHNMGVGAWKERFPDAKLFAPAQAIARVEKKGKVTGVHPLSEIGALAGPELELIDMPHYKTGEVLVRVKHGKHVVWYVTDVIMNLPKVPQGFFGTLSKWTKSAPGLRPNGISAMFMMKDKKSLYRWLRAEIEKAPPTTLLVCHGEHVMSGAAERLLEVLPS